MTKQDLIDRLSDLILSVDYSELPERNEVSAHLNDLFERLTGVRQQEAIPLF